MAGATPLIALLTLTGAISARIYDVRVWIDGSLNRSRRHDIWPPEFPSPCAANRHNGAHVAMLALLALATVGCLAGAIILTVVGFDGISAVALIAAAFYVFYGFGHASSGLFARFPAECWGTRDFMSREAPTAYNA
jgi:hypothetical protein